MFRILIAEDDRELRQLFQHVLMKNGYAVTGVADGKEALDAIDKGYYDLIISDIMMPVMDGYELVSSLRQAGIKLLESYGARLIDRIPDWNADR